MPDTPRSFESVWESIRNHAGEEFHTVRGYPFTYAVDGETVTTSRTDYSIGKGNFKEAYEVPHLTKPSQLNDIVRGPSYVFAIITDPRI